MCFFDNWGNFYNWNNWGNANVNVTPNSDPVTDGGTFDPTSSVLTTMGGTGSGQVYSATFTVQTPQAGDSFFLDLTDTGLTQVGNQVFYGDILIATVSGGEAGQPYVLTFSTASGSQYHRAGLITEVIDGVRFSNGGADESGSAIISINVQTSSGSFLPQVNVSYTAGVSAPGVGFDLTGGLSASEPQQTVDDGALYSERSGVTALADGGYVLVWQATGGPNNYDVFGQRYDASGQAVGGQFTVNTYTTNGQELPQVSALADGGFVVVWQSFGQDGMNSGIYGQRYGADGLPEGAEFRANTTTSQNENLPSVVGLADGGYVVIWQTYDGVSAYVSRGQWYDADGVAQGGEITLVATSQSDGVREATALADGGMAMLSQVYTGSQYELRLYIFDDAGAAVGSPSVVHTGYLNEGTHDITALAGGGFGVSWFENGAIKVQVFDDNGAAVGAVLTVPATANLNSLSVTDLAGGGFVVSWQGYIDGLWQVFAQAFGADGQADGGVASVSQGTYADTYQGQQSIAQLNDGTIVVTWTYNGQVFTRALEFSAPAVQTSEDGPAIPIILTGWDSDGSETLTITLSGFPEGATFNQGQAGPGDTWVIAGADPEALLTLQMVEPVNYTGEFTLTVTVSSVESSDNSTSTSTHEVDVIVGVNASTPVISIPRDGGTISNPSGIDTFASAGPGIGNTALADGGFLTVSFQPGTYAVLVHRFDAAGEPVGGATVIANPMGTKTLPSIAAAADGSYFVTWTHADGYDDIWAVFVDASGAAGTPFAVNTTTTNSQVHAQVVATSDGGFLVVWQSSNPSTGVPGIIGRKYDSSGAPEGGEFVIGVNYTNDYIQYQATQPRVTVLSDGSILVVWQENPNGSFQEIHGQFLSADGTPQGTELTLLAANGQHLTYPGVTAVAGGGWVLSWEGVAATHAQLFDADGSTVGDEFVVSTGIYGHAPITALTDGGYVVTWYANNDTLYAQRFDATGAEVGGVLTVGPGGPGYAAPAIVLDGDTLVFTYYFGGASAGQVRTFDYSSHGLTGHEDGAIAVPIEMTWPDQDGSETLTVTLSGFPEDATFSQGAAGVGGTWVIEVSDPAALADLTMTAPAGFMGVFLLTVTATTVESADGSSSTVDQVVEITVEAGASAIDIAPVALMSREPILYPIADVALADGGHLLISSEYVFNGSSQTVVAQRYDADGNPVGSPVTLIPGAPGNMYEAKHLEALAGGGFAFTTVHNNFVDGIYEYEVHILDADLNPVSIHTQPNNFSAYHTDIQALANGGFVIVDQGSLYHPDPTPQDNGVFLSVYAADGSLITNHAPLTLPPSGGGQTGTGYADVTIITLADGQLLVAYSTYATNYGDSGQVVIQMLSASGDVVGGPVVLGDGEVADVAALPDGGFVALVVDADNADVTAVAYFYDADNNLVGAPVPLADVTGYLQARLEVLDDGTFVATWGEDGQIVLQRFDASGPLGVAVIVDDVLGSAYTLTALEGGGVSMTWTMANYETVTEVFGFGPAFTGDEDTAIAVPLDLTWPDTDGSETLTVTLSGFPEGSTFNQGEAGIGGTWVIAVTDPADLLNLTMTPPANWNGEFELTVNAVNLESANGASAGDGFTVLVAVNPVSDIPPELTAPESIAVTEDTATALSGLSVADSDSASVTMTLAVASGTLDMGEGGLGLTFGTSTPGELTISGSPANINAYLASGELTWTPPADSTADVNLEISVSDGDQSDSTTVILDVTAVDDPSVIDSLPTSITLDEDSSVGVTGIVVSDVDSGAISVTLSLTTGALSATSGSGVTVVGTASALTLSGSASAINAFIAAGSVTYAPPANFNGSVELSVSVSDGGTADTGSVQFDVQAVNDAPEITASPATIDVVENTDIALTGFVFADIDSSPVTVTFAAASGTLTWTNAGPAFQVTGSGTGTLTIVADPAALNAAIAAGALHFLTALDSEADVAVTVTVADADYEDEAGVTLLVEPDTIDGTPGNDALNGDSRGNEIYGFDGADVIYGYGGADLIEGGKGADTLYGGAGADTFVFRQGDGKDVIQDGSTEDRIVVYGYSGYTVQLISPGADIRVVFDADNSILVKRSGQQSPMPVIVLMGTEAAETKIGGVLVDEIQGLGGNDYLKGDAGNDRLEGGDGNDLLDGGAGNDRLDGGDGMDRADYRTATSGVTVNLSLSTQQSTGGAGKDTLVSIEYAVGSAYNDVFTGNDAANILEGRNGNDVLNGGVGQDKLIGGNGNDTLTGGSEADQFWFNAGLFGADTVTDFQNGVDKIRISGIAGVDDLSDLAVTSNGAGWAVITFPDGSTITLTGVLATAVDATDFVWG